MSAGVGINCFYFFSQEGLLIRAKKSHDSRRHIGRNSVVCRISAELDPSDTRKKIVADTKFVDRACVLKTCERAFSRLDTRARAIFAFAKKSDRSSNNTDTTAPKFLEILVTGPI